LATIPDSVLANPGKRPEHDHHHAAGVVNGFNSSTMKAPSARLPGYMASNVDPNPNRQAGGKADNNLPPPGDRPAGSRGPAHTDIPASQPSSVSATSNSPGHTEADSRTISTAVPHEHTDSRQKTLSSVQPNTTGRTHALGPEGSTFKGVPLGRDAEKKVDLDSGQNTGVGSGRPVQEKTGTETTTTSTTANTSHDGISHGANQSANTTSGQHKISPQRGPADSTTVTHDDSASHPHKKRGFMEKLKAKFEHKQDKPHTDALASHGTSAKN